MKKLLILLISLGLGSLAAQNETTSPDSPKLQQSTRSDDGWSDPESPPNPASAFTAQPANGQNPGQFTPEVVWGLWFDFFFDNREYKSDVNWPQTIFGARLSPEVGLRWGSPRSAHSIMAGISLLAEFGTKPFETDNELFAYYQYHSPKFRAYAGVIPRHKVVGEYSAAFFSDSVKYFDPNLTGLLVQYAGGRGYVELGCDWNSKFGEGSHEKFLIFSSGRINHKLFYAGYNINMYHHAGTVEQDGVVDNIWLHPFIGVDLAGRLPLDVLSAQVGWIQTFQNDRTYVGEYVRPGGFQLQIKAQKWKFGIDNTLYLGDNLMPYWDDPNPDLDLNYGPGLYWGEPWYRTHRDVYNRLELYWQPIANHRMSLRLASVHHYDGDIWGWQQKILFRVNLGQNRLVNKRR